MKERKPKVKKIKTKKKFKASSIFFFFISLVLTVFVFMGLIIAENRLSGKTVYKEVLTVKKEVPVGEIITKENLSDYFVVSKIDIIDDVDGSFTNSERLLGKKALVPLVKNEVVLEKDFENICQYVEVLENPVQVAVDVGSLADIAGGIIREGDLVNINVSYASALIMDSSLGVKLPYASVFDLENVYVSGAIDSNGVRIAPSDTEANAVMLIFTVEKETETALTDALTNGNLIRISKVVK